jgi:pyruvate/2-oxoglutarate dehydrogenase complex dihydrolipoamide acyltransferase (E2) component
MMSSDESEMKIKTFAEEFKIDIDRFRALVKEAKAPQVKWGSKQAKELAEKEKIDVSSIQPTGKNGSIVLKDIHATMGKKPKSAQRKSSPSEFASKIAKELAEKHSIKADQITVRGSKDGKKIVKSDIVKYLDEKKTKENEPSGEGKPEKDDEPSSDDDSDDEQHSDDDN